MSRNVYIPKWDRVEHMNAGRERSALLRHRGLPTGSVWKAPKRAPDPVAGSIELFNEESRAKWKFFIATWLEEFEDFIRNKDPAEGFDL